MPALRQDETLCRAFAVPQGWCAVARTRKGICAFLLPLPDRDAAESEIRKLSPRARTTVGGFRKLVAAVRRYFNGWRTTFDNFPLDLSAGTAFQQRVWSVVRRIPYGNVRTYRWIGLEIGRPGAVRAIGNALGANPTPLIVPCHRVVNADGSLGGFSAPAGPLLKALMLQLERVPLHGQDRNRRVLAPRMRQPRP